MTRLSTHYPASLESKAREIVAAFGGNWRGKRGMCRCPAHDDRTPSLAIGLAPNAILFHCFAGCHTSKVLEAFKAKGIAPHQLFDGSGEVIHTADSIRQERPSPNALRLWRQSKPLAGSLAEQYLRSRAPLIETCELRFHGRMPLGSKPDVRFLPALVAAVRMDCGIIAIHRTFLDPTTGRKARFPKPKRALGPLMSGAVRLAVPTNGQLGLAEGIESAMSAMALNSVPTWATLGNERFGLVTVPESVTDLAAARGLEAHVREGRKIHVASPGIRGSDWNDEWQRLLAG